GSRPSPAGGEPPSGRRAWRPLAERTTSKGAEKNRGTGRRSADSPWRKSPGGGGPGGGGGGGEPIGGPIYATPPGRLRPAQRPPLSSSNRSSSLVNTSRNRSSSFAPRRHTVSRRSAAFR